MYRFSLLDALVALDVRYYALVALDVRYYARKDVGGTGTLTEVQLSHPRKGLACFSRAQEH